jgi:hypothetical protein
MGPVQGKNVIIFFDLGAGFKEFGCAETVSFEANASLIQTSTVGTGVDNTYDYQDKDYVINVSGILQVEDATNLTGWDILAVMDNFLELPYRMVFTDEGAISKTVSGRALVPRVAFDGSETDLANCSFQLQGTGSRLTTDGIITDVLISVRAQGQDGTTGSITVAKLVDDEDNEINLIPGGPVATVAYPAMNTVTKLVPSGVYRLRLTVVTSALGPSLEAHTLTHDAAPGDIKHPPPSSTTSYYTGTEPVWDFTVARTITLTTGVS